jgi:hypothetical protein
MGDVLGMTYLQCALNDFFFIISINTVLNVTVNDFILYNVVIPKKIKYGMNFISSKSEFL